jgi:GNAT superfamily N-acetyltransferase
LKQFFEISIKKRSASVPTVLVSLPTLQTVIALFTGWNAILEISLSPILFRVWPDFLMKVQEKGQIWVIDYWGTVQGSIGIVETEPDTAQLRWFLIEPEFRGLGLGRKLMETCLNHCSEKGYRKVYLWTFDELDAARHLYKIFGFRVTETRIHSPESFGLPFSVQFYFCPVFSRALSKVTLSLYSSFLPLFHCETGERNPTTLE